MYLSFNDFRFTGSTAASAVYEEYGWLKETFTSRDKELNALYGFCLNASLSPS